MQPIKNRSGETDSALEKLLRQKPKSKGKLHWFICNHFGLNIPSQVVTPGNTPPFKYICHTFFESGGTAGRERTPENKQATADAVVWASRGGGKTLLGALATTLDLIFKPGIKIKILGGSMQQSSRMYQHLLYFFSNKGFVELLQQPPTQQKFALVNNSEVEILAQSHTAVRGTRIHKLRCDEVDEFQYDIWQAAQLVTRSEQLGDQYVTGSIDALSTMHRPAGIMSKIIKPTTPATSSRSHNLEPGTWNFEHKQLFRWNALDVMEPCPPTRHCRSCPIFKDCRARGKHAEGFIPVNDLISQFHRTDPETWATEMICSRPRRSDSVYPNFKHDEHVKQFEVDFNAYRIIAAMDFGLRSPNVMLWAAVLGDKENAFVYIIYELHQTDITLQQCLNNIKQFTEQYNIPHPQWIAVDPAGLQRNQHTGLTDVDVLKHHGYKVKHARQPVQHGITTIRRKFHQQSLVIHPRCTQLIKAVTNYHFDHNNPYNNNPVKDGPDHHCDAMRYLIGNIENNYGNVIVRSYF